MKTQWDMTNRLPLIAGSYVPSPSERSRDVAENGGSPAASDTPKVVSTPEVVSGHLVAAMRSMTSPFHGVIMAAAAAAPLLFPFPVFHSPTVPLADLASFGTLPETDRRPWNGGGHDDAVKR